MHIISSAMIISPVTDMVVENCNVMFDATHIRLADAFLHGKFVQESVFVSVFVLAMIFSLGGYALWYRAWRREPESSRKRFLAVLGLYQVIAWIVFVPAIGGMGIRYFIILFFVPFLLLGLWSQYLLEVRQKYGKIAVIVLVSGLVVANMSALRSAALALAQGEGSDVSTSILGDDRLMVTYILGAADPHQKGIFVTGKKAYLKRFFKPLDYVAQESGQHLTLLRTRNGPKPVGTQSFFIAKTSPKQYAVGEIFAGQRIEGWRVFQDITIFVLRQP